MRRKTRSFLSALPGPKGEKKRRSEPTTVGSGEAGPPFALTSPPRPAKPPSSSHPGEARPRAIRLARPGRLLLRRAMEAPAGERRRHVTKPLLTLSDCGVTAGERFPLGRSASAGRRERASHSCPAASPPAPPVFLAGPTRRARPRASLTGEEGNGPHRDAEGGTGGRCLSSVSPPQLRSAAAAAISSSSSPPPRARSRQRRAGDLLLRLR